MQKKKKKNVKNEEEEAENEAEPPVVTPKSKGKKKILIEEEETELKWEEDIDAAIEEAINKATRLEEAKRSLREIIANITVEQPTTTTLTPTIGKETPTKSQLPGHQEKRKEAQHFIGVVVMHAPEEP